MIEGGIDAWNVEYSHARAGVTKQAQDSPYYSKETRHPVERGSHTLFACS